MVKIKEVIFVLEDGSTSTYRKESLIQEAITILIEDGVRTLIKGKIDKE